MEMRNSIHENVGFAFTDELISKACSLSMAAQKSSVSPTFVLEKQRNVTCAIFAFAGSWSFGTWYSGSSFGETKIDTGLFPSFRSIGNDQTAVVNGSFLRQFKLQLRDPNFLNEVNKAVVENRQLVFTGHGCGGSIAVLATLWQLEQQRKQDNHNQVPPCCLTFGSPLVGNKVFSHALRREGWSQCFMHFVMRYDIVPRILLTPYPSISHLFDPRCQDSRLELIGNRAKALRLFHIVTKNVSSIASHASSTCMGCTNLLLEAVTSFIELSPYRPFGAFIFCTGNGKLIKLKNPDSVLQLLYYSLQLSPEQDVVDVALDCLKENLVYESKLKESLQKQDFYHLEKPEELPLSSKAADIDEEIKIEKVLDDLGLSARARICIRAAGELEKQILGNQTKIDANFDKIEEGIAFLDSYRAKCEVREIGYYDAFKLQNGYDDFSANVKRLELAGIWDEIIEMLKRYELPDNFEVRKEWVDLGTKYRRLVEPLDIANFYRHSKNNDSGAYMISGRPKRYKYTQRWLEHSGKMTTGYYSESTFWAEIEQLSNDADKNKTFDELKERVLGLERDVLRWVGSGELGRDVLLAETTFVKWWRTLPHQHRAGSCLAGLMNGEARNLPPIY